MVFLALMVLIGVIAYGKLRPHVMLLRTKIEFFNDTCVMFVVYSCICMTEFNESDVSVFYNGYQFMFYVAIMVAGNLVVQGMNIKEHRGV
jgi:hypothetical protein